MGRIRYSLGQVFSGLDPSGFWGVESAAGWPLRVTHAEGNPPVGRRDENVCLWGSGCLKDGKGGKVCEKVYCISNPCLCFTGLK